MSAEEGTPPASAELLPKLNGMKLRALQAKAEELGVDDDKLDDAEEKQEVIALIVAKLDEQAAEAEAKRVAALQQELGSMKLRALQRRAVEVGVPEERLDDAEDKSEVIALIVAAAVPSPHRSPYEAEEVRAATAAKEAARLMRLKEELSTMKLRALQQRAAELGVDDDALDEAEDKIEMIELIMAIESKSTTDTLERPHSGNAMKSKSISDTGQRIFKQWWDQGLHVMFSYQWDVQKEVQQAHELLTKKGVPVWMDTNGGMAADIYNSMAEGVQNAAVIVCFMTQKYEESSNCALELKFGHQLGKPIVPVKIQQGFAASGWLGILTAGLLWTRLWDPATFAEDIDSLVEQIVQAVESVATVVETVAIKEVKDELLRLREDSGLQSAESATAAKEAHIPALVPSLPAGILITPAMEELLLKLLDPSTPRVGFCGMGGIGKTVVSSWLVRQSEVRKAFSKIIWVTVGQSPDLDALQRVLYEQLVSGGSWDENLAPDVKTQRMGEAFRGQKVLLVVDDIWNSEHERALNYVDDTTSSKVLVSSRVRGSLEGNTCSVHTVSGEGSTAIVHIELPSEEQAVQMLLSTAGISADQSAPKEAHDLVKFCNMLPLAVSIAGQLVKDLELDAAEDWDGILAILKDEFAHGGRQSVEDTVILTSLKSISGPHKDNVTSLFKCLAIVPEDTIVPLDILAIIFQAGCSTDENPVSRPRIMMIRKWLKLLLERSLVLGTVDRISLHDIVRDFTLNLYTGEELRQAHRRLINLLRQSRPQAPNLMPAWSTAGEVGQADKTVAYVRDLIGKHIEQAICLSNWDSDTLLVNSWLGDCPQDIITNATAKVLGMERLEKLIAAAEDADDQWALARRAVLAGNLAKTCGSVGATYERWRCAVDALSKLAVSETTPQERQIHEALELETLGLGLVVANDPADARYLPRMHHLVQQEHLNRMPHAQAMCHVFICTMTSQTDLTQYASLFAMYVKTLAVGARTHPDQRMRSLCKLFQASAGMMQPCFTNEDWDWDALFLDEDGTNFMQHITELYTFETCHNFMVTEQGVWGLDCMLNQQTPYLAMAYHYGQLAEAVKHFEEKAMAGMDLLLTQPNQELEYPTMLTYFFCWPFTLDLKCPAPLRIAMEKSGVTWSMADATWDRLYKYFPIPLRPRGEVTEGYIMTIELFSWCGKLVHALVGGAEEIPAEEIVASLPSWEEHISIVKASLPFSYCYAVGGEIWHMGCMIALLYEKLGCVNEALDWAERIATLDDPFKGGNLALVARLRGLCVQGRCLATKDQQVQAEAALTSAAEQYGSVGYYLGEVLALRDLFVCVLKGTDRESEGLTRLREAIVRLVGVDAAPEQLNVLATSLGDELDLVEVLAHA